MILNCVPRFQFCGNIRTRTWRLKTIDASSEKGFEVQFPSPLVLLHVSLVTICASFVTLL